MSTLEDGSQKCQISTRPKMLIHDKKNKKIHHFLPLLHTIMSTLEDGSSNLMAHVENKEKNLLYK